MPPTHSPKPEARSCTGLTDQAEPPDQFVSRCPLQSWYPPYDLGSCEFRPVFAPAEEETLSLASDPSDHV